MLGFSGWSVAMMVLCGFRKQRVKPVIRRLGHDLSEERQGVLIYWLYGWEVGGASMVVVMSTPEGTLL